MIGLRGDSIVVGFNDGLYTPGPSGWLESAAGVPNPVPRARLSQAVRAWITRLILRFGR